jgi:hypothetical protein
VGGIGHHGMAQALTDWASWASKSEKDVLSQAICRMSRLSWHDSLLVSACLPVGGDWMPAVSQLICRAGGVVSVYLPG